MLKKIILLFFIVLLLFISIYLISHPLLKSEYKIRKNLLKVIPIGTRMDQALQMIKKNKKWEIQKVNYDLKYRYLFERNFNESMR